MTRCATPTDAELLAKEIADHRKRLRAEADAMRYQIEILGQILAKYQRGDIIAGLFGAERKP